MPVARATRVMMGLLVWIVVGLGVAGIATAEDPPDYRSSFGPDGTEITGFEAAGSVAIDQLAGSVYVVDRPRGSVFKFDLEGDPVDFGGSAPNLVGNELTGLAFTSDSVGFNQIAVTSASHTIYVTANEGKDLLAFQQDGEPSLFTAGSGSGTQKIEGFINLVGVAVDAAGNIYASDNGPLDGEDVVRIYEPSGELLTEFAVINPGNLAVDGNGIVYVNRLQETVLKFTPSETPVTGATTFTAASDPLDAKNSYTVSVDPATNDVYVAHTFVDPGIAWYDESGALLATFGQPSEAGGVFSVEGLAVGPDERVFVANVPEAGLSQVEVFGAEIVVVDKPVVQSVAAAQVTADSARILAEINPNTLPTTYRVEFGLGDCASFTCDSVPVGGAEAGSGHFLVPIVQQITGLQPNTIYHYRVVAENEVGDNLEEEIDHTFTTQEAALDFKLGDGRVWELVSPPDKHGANLVSAYWGHLQAADDGNGIAYLSHNSIEADPEGNRILEPSSVLARRGEAGWNSKDITSLNERVVPVPNGQQSEFKLFSADLAEAMLEPISGALLSSEASERTPYLRDNTVPPHYTPMVSGKEGFANVPAGTVFGGENSIPNVRVQAANSDLTHIVLTSKTPLTPGAPEPSLYRWTAGQLEPVSVLPQSEGGLMTDELPVVGSFRGSVRHAISEDGSRIFWSTTDGPLTGLYMRDMEAGETVRVDINRGGSDLGNAEPEFQGASADGSVVFFTDSHQLTSDASSSGRDLYRCEIPDGESAAGCTTLADLSVPTNSGENAEVKGIVSALSEDGSAVYFVARGVLDETPNQLGVGAKPGELNLYSWQEDQGVRFIAPLSPKDEGDWGGEPLGPYKAQTSEITAAGSPSGRYFTFMSELSLSGQGNTNPETGEAVEQIFRYDADGDDLVCVSCSPTGTAPVGQVIPDKFGLLVDPLKQWIGRRAAATIPSAFIIEVAGISLYRPRSVFDSGRVLFNAFDPLVPADSNGEWDVYQYEPTGVGDCVPSSAGAAVVRTGEDCVSLMSSGAAEKESGFVDASANGDDVFFFTSARLSAIDVDQERDIYDARVNGRSDKAPVITECAGEACQPFTGPPNDPTPASSAFEGPGNVKAKTCPKGKRKVKKKGKVRCVPKHKKSQKKQKRAGQNQRAAR